MHATGEETLSGRGMLIQRRINADNRHEMLNILLGELRDFYKLAGGIRL